MLRPRCIFTDLDGTLFGVDSELSERTVAALRAADAAGVLIVAATGRSHHTTTPRLAPARAMRWALCSNGAVRFDLHSGRPVRVTTLDKPTIAALIAAVRRATPRAAFGWETVAGFGFEPEFSHTPETFDRRGGPQALTEVEAAVKIYIDHPHLTDVALQRALADHLPAGVVAATSGAPFVEATAATANKGAAAAALVAELGIGAGECVAIGDQMNDLSLLTWAGHAIAMSNAHPEILAVADEVTGHHAEDGAAAAIERLIALPR